MDEADAGVELRIPGQALLDAGHPDQHHGDAGGIEMMQERDLEVSVR